MYRRTSKLTRNLDHGRFLRLISVKTEKSTILKRGGRGRGDDNKVCMFGAVSKIVGRGGGRGVPEC